VNRRKINHNTRSRKITNRLCRRECSPAKNTSSTQCKKSQVLYSLTVQFDLLQMRSSEHEICMRELNLTEEISNKIKFSMLIIIKFINTKLF